MIYSIVRLSLLTIIPLAIGGCPSSVIPGPIAQLDRYQKAEQSGRPGDIVGDPLNSDCAAGAAQSDACPKLHAIRARACLQQAQAVTAPAAICPGSGARDLLACANENYGDVLSDQSFSADQRSGFRDNRAVAAYCLANMSGGTDRQRLGRQVMDDLAGLARNPRRDQLAANTWLLLAEASSGTAQCDQYRQAAAAAAHGLASGPSTEVAAGLQSALNGAQTRANRAGCGRI